MKTKRGRPKGPETVMYRKRLTPEQKKEVSDFVRGLASAPPDAIPANPSPIGVPEWHESLMEENSDLKTQIKALLEDVDRLTKEVALFEVKRENWMKATPNQQVQAVWREVEKWKSAAQKLQDQISS